MGKVKVKAKVVDEVVEDATSFLLKHHDLLRAAVEELPEVRIASKLLKEKGIDPEGLVEYLIFAAASNWGLRIRGGSIRLWEALLEEAEASTAMESYTRLAEGLGRRLKVHRERMLRIALCLDGSLRGNTKSLISSIIRRKSVPLKALKDLIMRLRGCTGLSIPVEKAANLIARTIYFTLNYNVKDKQSIMYDVHVAKVSLRLKIVELRAENTDIIVIGLFNRRLRKSIVEAWDKVSEKSAIPAWGIDALLWLIGRRYCLFDNEAGSVRARNPSCPMQRLTGRIECPLVSLCRTAQRRNNILVFSRSMAGTEVAVTLLQG